MWLTTSCRLTVLMAALAGGEHLRPPQPLPGLPTPWDLERDIAGRMLAAERKLLKTVVRLREELEALPNLSPDDAQVLKFCQELEADCRRQIAALEQGRFPGPAEPK